MNAKLARAIVETVHHALIRWAATSVFQAAALVNISENTVKGKYLQIIFLLLFEESKIWRNCALSLGVLDLRTHGEVPLENMICYSVPESNSLKGYLFPELRILQK